MATDRIERLVIPSGLTKRPDATRRIICFSWAGAGPSYFIRLAVKFPKDIEVLVVRVPGREGRIQEEPYHSIGELVHDVTEAILNKYTNKPFAFVAHSLGARVCYEVALNLLKRGHQPTHMIVSGSFAPHSVRGTAWIRANCPEEMTDEGLLMYMETKGGTPPGILKDKAMQRIFLPPLKTDLKLMLAHDWEYEGEPQLSCPIFAMDGQDDTDHFLDEWGELTTGKLTIKSFPGGHFFLVDPNKAALYVSYISGILSEGVTS